MATCKVFRHFSTITMLMFLICWISTLEQSEARPQWTMPSASFSRHFVRETQCNTNDEIDELCQRCAKATKSNIAYPLCCKDEEKAQQWCTDYIYFGIRPSDDDR